VTTQTKYETHEHDVLIIGAGGAGLRAAIEGLAAGARVAVVSKSLLGKAHTVMAEGGIAAAMANVDKADSWRTHFRDTMRGGKLDCFSCVNFSGPRHSTWRALSAMNEHHMLFAWMSLISVGFADFYVRLVSSGAIRDLRIL